MIQKHLQEITKAQSEKCSENSDYEERNRDFSSLPISTNWNTQPVTDTEDELFLVIENNNDNDSGVFITKEQRFFHEMDVNQRRALDDTPKRKFRYSRDFESLKDHAINNFNPQENFTRTSFKFDMVHNQIRSKLRACDEIIDQEHSFLTKINKYSLDDHREDFLQTDFEFADIEYCDNNATMIVWKNIFYTVQ